MAHRRWVTWVLALGLLVIPATAFAGPSAEGVLKDKQSDLISELKKGKGTSKKVDEIFDSFLDYGDLAKDSLGQYWDERSDAEKKEFTELLKKLVRNAYRTNLKKTLNYDVAYKGQDQAKKGVLVRTVATSKTNAREEPLSIDYAMHEVNGNWTVYDVITEGASLVSTYRNQFAKVIKSKGFDELMKRMKKKAAAGG